MIEIDLASQQPDADRPAIPVTVIGLGGAGTNILDTVALEGLPGAQLVALNTDARALQSSMLGVKLQLGQELTRGLGAGGDPDLGAEAVRASEADIREEIAGQKMVFLCTGLGGGTGSGAAPLVARLAREEGAFVVVFAVMPFAFEGKRRLRQAEEALAALRAEADALITFDNDRLGEVVLPKKGIHEAFAAADKIVSQSIRAIINLVSSPGLIRIGIDELIAAVGRGDTRCLFGYGAGRGENRVSEALAGALKSPLLHKGQLRERGRSVLVHVCGGPQMTFAEVQDLMRELNDGHLHEEARILFGTGVDAAMGDQLSLTLLTSLSPEEVHPEKAAAAPPVNAEAPDKSESPRPATRAPAAPAPTPAPVAEVTPPPLVSERIVRAPEEPAPEEEEVTVEPEDTADPPVMAREAVVEPTATAAVMEEAAPAALEEGDEDVSPKARARQELEADEADEAEAPEAPEAPDGIEAPTAPVEEWVPSHVRQGITARMAAEAQAGGAVTPPPPASRSFHLRDLAHEKATPAPSSEPARPASPTPRVHPFKSWQREEERRDPNAPIEYENVGSVSEFEPAAPTPPPSDLSGTLARTPKSASRLGFLAFGRGSREAAAPPSADSTKSHAEQETFDRTLRPLPSTRGRFEKAEPTIEEGEDLDVPTFMRRKH
ncbi:MAG: cell division protein FtsZ [Verrucomicrobiales bacterium]